MQEIKLKNIEMGQNIFESLVDNFPDIIHSVDENGKIINTNKKACELLGYTKDELIGKSIRDIYSASIFKQVEKGLKALQKDGTLDGIESILISKSGESIPVEIRSFALYDENEIFLRTFSIIRDVRKVKEMESQLIQSSKMAAIGEISTCLAHDIRNPISTIKMYTENLEKLSKQEKLTNENLSKIIEALNRSCDKIVKLSDHLCTFSRSENEELHRCNILKILENSEFILANKIMKTGVNIEHINYKINNFDYSFVGQENAIEQVFINILSNACDAILEANRKNPKISIQIENEDANLKITISDNGPGIKEENISKLFNSFFTTKPKGQGTGLGLSICKSIIDKHKGEITVESIYGKGVNFYVKLPRN